MKTRFTKYLFSIIMLAAVFTALAACSGKQVPVPTFDEKNQYTGFASIPAKYTQQQAQSDGLVVLNNNKPVSEKNEAWTDFLKASQKGKNAFVRVALFTANGVQYDDLYFTDGKYRLFTQDKVGKIKDNGEFRYLVSAKESGLNAYVLTNTPDVDAIGAAVKSYLANDGDSSAECILLRFTLFL